MKQRLINERWNFWVPDNVADWDAPDNWERERLASMEELLSPGMVLFDIGTEHGWLSAIYGTFVGHENMVMVEPSPFFWPNIRRVWGANSFRDPLAAINAYCGERSHFPSNQFPPSSAWPPAAVGPECDAQAYVSLAFENLHDLPTVTIDNISGHVALPHAITIDIEGAELLALKGAEETLRTDRPLVWVSEHPDLMQRDYGYDQERLHEWMNGLGYHGELIAVDHEEHWLYR